MAPRLVDIIREKVDAGLLPQGANFSDSLPALPSGRHVCCPEMMLTDGAASSFDRSRLLSLTAVELTGQTRHARADARVLRSWAQAVRRRRVIAGASDRPDISRNEALLVPSRDDPLREPTDRAERRRRGPSAPLTQARTSGSAFIRSALHALWLRGVRASASSRYGVGVVAALVPSLLRLALNPYLGLSFPYVFYFPATMFTALFGGLGPAGVGIGICVALTTVWILPPIGSLAVSNPVDLVGLPVFIVADGIIAWIGASHRSLIEQGERQTTESVAREQALSRAVAEAETANRAKDDFLAVLSHELRTPLTTIVAGARVLHQIGSPEPRAASVRDAIERQAAHLVRLVNDLLDVKRIVNGPVILERHPCDLAEVVAGFVATWNGSGRFKDHTLFVDVETVWINGDGSRLQQVVDNLTGNAVKYTPAGGSIAVSIKHEGNDAVLRVQDSGIGISAHVLPRLFELFMQGDPDQTRVRTGLGIGLAVVRRLVELHDGTVQAASDGPGKGSTFTVRLPCVPAPTE